MSLLSLWLPILLSAVLVFVGSSIVHMVIQFHSKDWKKLPGEVDILEVMRKQEIPPGEYCLPHADSMKEMGSPEMLEKYRKGPVGFVAIMPSGPPNLVKSLTQWFLFSILISIFTGYIGTLALGYGADYMKVFQVTGTVAILGYAAGYIQDSIWKGQSWWVCCKFVLDGILYGLLTAGVFGWLWPEA